MDEKELLIIIPAYNESRNIGAVLAGLDGLGMSGAMDVLVVNDASTDGTGQAVAAMGHDAVTHVCNMGYGCALQTGYKYAASRGYRYVIQMDGDGQHDVCNVPVLYRALQEKGQDGRFPDIVLAARFRADSSDFPVSAAKRAAYAMFRVMIRMATGRRISDPTTGLQALSRKAFCYYAGYGHFDDKYPDANMLVLMMLAKFKVTEVPAVMHARASGRSMHSGLKPIWYMARAVCSIFAVIFRVKVLGIDADAGLEGEDEDA